jgi:serine/threonine protein kinase
MHVLDVTPDAHDTPDLPDPFEVQRQTSRQLAKPTVEGYTIVAFIGEGTYGDVWKGVHKESGTVDAIKRLHKRPDAQARGEARMLAALSAARGIVRLKKTQLENEPYCYVMEFMQGGTLGELIERSGKLPFTKAWEMFRELVEGLRYVHREGAVHCDIKPDNILLDALGKPRLSDFGQARGHGPGGASLGTPFYMPPEQARLGLPDPRWDVYALGAVLYQMLTGTKPRHNHELANELSLHSQSSTEVNTRLQKYAAHLDRVPGIGELKEVDPGVVDLLKRCLANDFEARPKDACEVYSLVSKLERKRRRRSLLFFGAADSRRIFCAASIRADVDRPGRR